MNKKLNITLPILIVIVISIVMTMFMMRNNQPAVDPNLNIVDESEEEIKTEDKMNKLYVNINGEKFEVKLEDNSTVSALINIQPLELTMSDLNGNEKYAYLDESLPTNTYSPGYIEAGDVMLYGDNCLVIFYKSFDTDYEYSKIGHIESLPELDDGDVSITVSAEN